MLKKFYLFSLLFIFTLLSSAAFALSLASSAFFNQDTLPVIYTCDGKNISPELTFKNVPEKTQSFVLLLSDSDAPAGTFYHWVLFNLPSTTSQLPEGVAQYPQGTMIGKNSWGKQEYNGPCPPKGSTHRYIFSLYALNTTLSLPTDSEAPAVLNAIQNHVLGNAELKALYTKI